MTDTRPNIVFIITDQQRYDTLGALGYSYANTPAVDRLVREGTAFTQCHVAGASCAPARGALFTGYYPHTTGNVRNGDLWRHTWLEHFQAAGYYTVNIGKMHTEPMDTPAGFDERFNVENKQRARKAKGVNQDYLDEWDRALGLRGHPRPTPTEYGELPNYETCLGAFDWPWEPELHPDTFVGDLANWWIDRKPRKQPTFLQIGFPGPHPPYDPLREEAEKYLDQDLPVLPVAPGEIESQPQALQDLRKLHMEVGPDSTLLRPDASLEERKRQRAYYLANQTMIDRKVGEILEQLKKKGYLDNAVVVFTSDHGDCLGDHGLSQKWSGYDQITRVPLVVWGPGRVAAGQTVDGLVQQQDIVSYLMQVAGIELPTSFEVNPLNAALEANGAGAFAGRDAVYCENGKERHMSADMLSMVRTADWKLVHFLGNDLGQLFDLKNDPQELKNLWNDAGALARRKEMMERLFEWRLKSSIQASDWAAEYR